MDVSQDSQARVKVSACLLTYNHAHVVAEVVRSLLAQDLGDFELLVSDDCSRDGTYETVERAAAGDARLRLVRTPHNLGMAGNANHAVRLARGEYVALLHHDDLYAPSLLRRWAELLDRHPSAGFVSNAYAVYGSSRVDVHPFREINPGREILERHMLPLFASPVRGTAMIRKRCWDAVGGMRLQFGMLADVDLWMRLAERYDVAYVAEPLIMVRHDRPEDYPGAYSGWSWSRLRLAHELYGLNHEEHYGTRSPAARLVQARYRMRVNAEIARWLAYAIVKRRQDMLRSSDEVASRYEYRVTRALRRALAALTR